MEERGADAFAILLESCDVNLPLHGPAQRSETVFKDLLRLALFENQDEWIGTLKAFTAATRLLAARIHIDAVATLSGGNTPLYDAQAVQPIQRPAIQNESGE